MVSRNEVIKQIIAKLAADKKIHSLVSDSRSDTWKLAGRTGELKIEWKDKFATKFTAPPGEALNRIIEGLRARPHT